MVKVKRCLSAIALTFMAAFIFSVAFNICNLLLDLFIEIIKLFPHVDTNFEFIGFFLMLYIFWYLFVAVIGIAHWLLNEAIKKFKYLGVTFIKSSENNQKGVRKNGIGKNRRRERRRRS